MSTYIKSDGHAKNIKNEYKKILAELQNKGCQKPQWCKCARTCTPQQHTLCIASTGAQFTLLLKKLSKESSGLRIM